MVFALKAQRITTRKLPKDRFITCQIHASSQEKEGYTGCLFSLIEIDNKQYSIAQVGHSIINTTAREYFRLDGQEASENFEQALKKTNEILANYTQEGETDWIGNLHGLIALVYKDEIHLACVGNSYALLIRDGKINNITPVCSNDNDVHPLCTFSNITSGPLEKNDVVVLASKNIFTHIPKKSLKQLIEINSLEESSLELGHILSENKVFDTNAIFIETTTKEDIASDPLSNIPDTIFIDELNDSISRKVHHLFHKTILPTFSKLFQITKNFTSIFGHWTKNKGLPKSKKYFDSAAQSLSPFFSSIKKSATNKMGITLKPDHEKNVKINHYYQFKKIKLPKLPKLPLYPVIICCLAAILIFSLLIKIGLKKPKTTPKESTTKNNIDLPSFQTKFSLAKSANDKEAINLYEQIIEGLDNKNLTTDQSTLLTQTKSKYSTLTKSKIITLPESTISLPEKNMKIIIYDNNIYTFGATSIFKGPINTTKLTLAGQLPANSGNIIDVTGPTATKKFIIYTSKQKIIEYTISKNTFNELTSTEPWKNATSILSYNNNLYLLNAQDNQIWKYTPTKTSSYNKATPYTNSTNLSISSIVDISIDEKLFSISQNGQLSKVEKIGLTPINYSDFPSQKLIPQSPKSFFTKNENDYFFIQEIKQITLVDKQGKYVEQFKLNQGTISDLYVQPVLRQIWIIADKTLFSYTYK